MCTLPRELREFYRVSDGMFIRWTVKIPGGTDAIPLGRIRINPIAGLKRIVSEKDAVEWSWGHSSDDDVLTVLKWPAFELDSSNTDVRVALIYFSQCTLFLFLLLLLLLD